MTAPANPVRMTPELVPSGAAAVTKSNTTVLAGVAGLFVGTGGTTLKVTDSQGNDTTFTNVPNGTIIWGRFTKVWNTGTDAADIVALLF